MAHGNIKSLINIEFTKALYSVRNAQHGLKQVTTIFSKESMTRVESIKDPSNT